MTDYILQACFILMREKPFEKITVSEIAAKAGVDRSTYYRYFKSKEEIIHLFFQCIFSDYLGEIRRKQVQSLKEYVMIMLTHFYQHKDDLILVYKNKLFSIFLDVAEAQYDPCDFSTWEHALTAHIQCYHLGGVHNLMRSWVRRGMQETPEQLSGFLVSIKGCKLIGADIEWQIGGQI